MTYTIGEQIADATQDLKDIEISFERAKAETKEATEWESKMFDWVQASKKRLENLVSQQKKSDTEVENQNYIDKNISYLEEYFYKNLAKTDDRDDFEAWLDNHEQGELIVMIKAKQNE